MTRTTKALIVAMATSGALVWGAAPASAGPVVAEPEAEGVTVTATFEDADLEQTLSAGGSVEGDNGKPGLCATGDIHESCTPASEAGTQG